CMQAREFPPWTF
nr:immunoglobulin light chain junction region [Macaca mulatta]